MPASQTQRSAGEVTAMVLLRLLQQPNTWTTRGLAAELGETPNRVNNAVRDIQRAGWTISRPTERGNMTVSLPEHTDAREPAAMARSTLE